MTNNERIAPKVDVQLMLEGFYNPVRQDFYNQAVEDNNEILDGSLAIAGFRFAGYGGELFEDGYIRLDDFISLEPLIEPELVPGHLEVLESLGVTENDRYFRPNSYLQYVEELMYAHAYLFVHGSGDHQLKFVSPTIGIAERANTVA